MEQETKKTAEFRVVDKKVLGVVLPCVAKDASGYSHNGVLLEKDQAVGTDGRICVKVPYPKVNKEDLPLHLSDHNPACNGDKFIMPADQAKAAIKAIPNSRYKPILEHATIGIRSTEKAELRTTDLGTCNSIDIRGLEGDFPVYENVYWDLSKEEFTVTLGIPVLESLLKSAKAGVEKDRPFINLHFQSPEPGRKTMNESIAFDFDLGDGRKAEGVFMPVVDK